jgi:hypothetical protein
LRPFSLLQAKTIFLLTIKKIGKAEKLGLRNTFDGSEIDIVFCIAQK